MDRAYEGDETRQWALDLGYVPVVPPKSNRLDLSISTEIFPRGGADKILDYVEVVHVFIRRSNSSR
jgi:hypothetical protein